MISYNFIYSYSEIGKPRTSAPACLLLFIFKLTRHWIKNRNNLGRRDKPGDHHNHYASATGLLLLSLSFLPHESWFFRHSDTVMTEEWRMHPSILVYSLLVRMLSSRNHTPQFIRITLPCKTFDRKKGIEQILDAFSPTVKNKPPLNYV